MMMMMIIIIIIIIIIINILKEDTELPTFATVFCLRITYVIATFNKNCSLLGFSAVIIIVPVTLHTDIALHFATTAARADKVGYLIIRKSKISKGK